MSKRVALSKLLTWIGAVYLLFGITIAATTNAQIKATIDVVDKRGKLITVKFSEEDLRRVEQDVNYILTKLQRAGVKVCCPPRSRVSDCIWECCDSRQVRTCDATLTKALTKLWGEE